MENAPKKNRILAEHPDTLREIDGVTLDLESYARHCPSPAAPTADTAATVTTNAPAEATPKSEPSHGVFDCEPQHIGWYPDITPPLPIMGGAIDVTSIVWNESSGSGSASSYRISYRFGSGSGSMHGSWRGSQSSVLACGYGLELI